jgi:hypothetical protein
MWKRLRIAILAYVLIFVAADQYLTARASKDWAVSLSVDIYCVAGDDTQSTREYLDKLSTAEFKHIETFFAEQAHAFGVALEQPFRLNLRARIDQPLPQPPATPAYLDTIIWSLQMRWRASTLRWQEPEGAADIIVFAVFHDGTASPMLDRSTALPKGLIAVVNLFADRAAHGSNQVVLAHELLHVLGATDKYEPVSNIPRFPEGFAAPNAVPLFPQSAAELMAGRIAIGKTRAEIPASLAQVVIGRVTAAEIGWVRRD